MAVGWIRAYADENTSVRSKSPYRKREARAQFRKSFKTEMKKSESETSSTIQKIGWGREVDLPDGLSKDDWTKIKYRGKIGFVLSGHLVEIAYVKKKSSGSKKFVSKLEYGDNKKKDVLWGDLVQITKPGTNVCQVRVRGFHGKMNRSDLMETPLLELYFIDVAQGDGVFMKTPDGRHMLIDGGLERKSQQTGKNAADFVDWKYFIEYGHYRIELDSMMTSHSDTDHYGGLHDMVRINEQAERELDSLETDIKVFHHPGLSRWKKRSNVNPPHKDGMGPQEDGFFTQLLGDRSDAEKSVDGVSPDQLSWPWSSFIEAVLKNDNSTKFVPVHVESEDLKNNANLPLLWPTKDGCEIKVLGPVTKRVNGKLGLKDLGDTGKNSNGHSICLRVDYGKARILLTGDLNKKSMDWIMESYGDRIGSWACDVAKACHHGSDDISYRFLEEVKAAATIISSGDAEGHAHPRPEIVGACAMTGFTQIDRNKDKLVTPLIYMTEIERSVSLGSINRIDIQNLSVDNQNISASLPARHIDELVDRDFLTPEQRKDYNKLKTKSEKSKFIRKVVKAEKPLLEALESDMQFNNIKVDFNISMPIVPFGTRNEKKRAWRCRVMEKNHYGLVNVRTDGETMMCATLNETGKKWITHNFPTRF